MEITDKAAPVSTQARAGTEPNVTGVLIRQAGNVNPRLEDWVAKTGPGGARLSDQGNLVFWIKGASVGCDQIGSIASTKH